MKKLSALACVLCLCCTLFVTGCSNTDSNPTQSTTQPVTVAPVMPDKDGKIAKTLLDSDNMYMQYAPDDTNQEYPITQYECEEDGTVITGDIYEYNSNHNETKRVHYEGNILDYTEVREYDEQNRNIRIISYAGEIRRENLVSTCVMDYDSNNNEIKSTTYDSENTLAFYDETTYILINGNYEVESRTYYNADDTISEKAVCSYRQDGTLAKEIRTVYNGEKVKYYCQTAYDMNGDMVSYTYFDKNNKKIPEPEEEKEYY